MGSILLGVGGDKEHSKGAVGSKIRFSLGPELQTIQKVLLWDYVELLGVLPLAGYTLFSGWEVCVPKEVPDQEYLEWVQAFAIYMAALVAKYPDAATRLICDQKSGPKVRQVTVEGLQHPIWDQCSGDRPLTKVNTDLYTRFFTGGAKEAKFCTVCDSTVQGHDVKETWKSVVHLLTTATEEAQTVGIRCVRQVQRKEGAPSKRGANINTYVGSVGSSILPKASQVTPRTESTERQWSEL